MNKELEFFIKLVRNGVILAGLLFISMWVTSDINFAMCKTSILFFAGYVLTELAVRYKLKIPVSKKAQINTLFF